MGRFDVLIVQPAGQNHVPIGRDVAGIVVIRKGVSPQNMVAEGQHDVARGGREMAVLRLLIALKRGRRLSLPARQNVRVRDRREVNLWCRRERLLVLMRDARRRGFLCRYALGS